MAGMLRFKNQEELDALLRRGNMRVRASTDKVTTNPVDRKCWELLSPRPVEPLPKTGSDIEELFAMQISTVGNLPPPIREYHHLRGRAHRLDFAWPEYRVNGMQLGAEVQGMVHRVKGTFSKDLEKRALGLLQGWLILEVGGEQIRNGRAMEWLQELFTKAVKS